MEQLLNALKEQVKISYFIDYLSQINAFELVVNLIQVIIIIFVTYLLLRIRYNIIMRTFKYAHLDEKKKDTLISLLINSTKYLLVGISVLFIITLFVPLKQITPILAGAGVIGLAIGFGAQSLVKDVITGFFIMFEDQFHVGDFIELNDNVKGTVEEMGLRMTTLREWSGKKYYIANSEIQTVRNFNRKEMRALVYATFPYHENPQKIRELLEEVCREIETNYGEHLLKNSFGQYLEPPQIWGVLDINDNERGGTYVVTAKTIPTSLWTIEKTIKETIWQKCIEHNIELAYPRRILENSEISFETALEDN